MGIVTSIGVRFYGLMIALALTVFGPGLYLLIQMPVDVLPELNAPTVTILTEAHQMGPEAVELQISLPLESALQGMSGLRRLKSASGAGLSMVVAEFAWNVRESDARLQVLERLQTVSDHLPTGVDTPIMTPPSSIMGEIIFLGVTGSDSNLLAARQFADTVLRPRLLSVPGVAQITILGAGNAALQVELDPYRLQHFNIPPHDVLERIKEADGTATAGYHVQGGQAFMVRALGRSTTVEDFENIAIREGIRVSDIARVSFGAQRPIGLGSVEARPAVILAVGRQPQANTLKVSEEVQKVLNAMPLPDGLKLHTDLFRQEHFIRAALSSLKKALAEGSILVVVVVLFCLWSIRASIICLLALPLSMIVALLVLHAFGVSINSMTLGGLTIAVGALVDDAIVFVENTMRRFNESNATQSRELLISSSLAQVAGSITYATAIIVAVFIPLFFLSGIEGRLFQPLGIAYVTALIASLFVAVFITPALIFVLGLSKSNQSESRISSLMHAVHAPFLNLTIARPAMVLTLGLLLSVFSVWYISSLGSSFLPPFREGALTIEMSTIPGTALTESDRLGSLAERILQTIPGVTRVSRRSGRANDDAHAVDASLTEIEVVLDLSLDNREEILENIRSRLSSVSGAVFNIGQPISHRIDHILSGARAMLVVAVFGEDLSRLEGYASKIKGVLEGIPHLVDVGLESQGDQPELRIEPHLSRLADYSLTPHDVAEHVELLFDGVRVSEILRQSQRIPVIVKYLSGSRQSSDLRDYPIVTPVGPVKLSAVADVSWHRGPNRIGREDRSRRILVTANVAGSDPGSAARRVEEALLQLPPEAEMHWQLRGQFEARKTAAAQMMAASVISLFLVGWLLHLSLGSLKLAVLTILSLPLSFSGGALGVYYSGGIVSLASLVGFLTLFGIAARNGILLLERFRDAQATGMNSQEAVLTGTRERLLPVFMTAISTALGLLPLVIAQNAPGNEIQAPMAAVILGGLLSSTFLSVVVVPALWLVFSKGVSK